MTTVTEQDTTAAPAEAAPKVEAPKTTKVLKPRITEEMVKRSEKFDGKAIGEKFEATREMMRIEPGELKRIGITTQRIKKIEENAGVATLEELHRLASATGYSVGGLINRITKGHVGEIA
jgi:hypothetical protein